jgi:hypothetical protein
MKKRIVGIYNNVQAAKLEIDKLKGLGHDEHSIFLLTKDQASASTVVHEKGIQMEEIPKDGMPEAKGDGVLSKLFYALDYETQHSGVASILKSAGVNEDEVGTYVRRLEQGHFVVLAREDAPNQPFSDESDAGFSNEEQSMQYYEQAMNGEKRSVDALVRSNRITTYDESMNNVIEPHESFIPTGSMQESGGRILGNQTDYSHTGKEDIYVEHIYFESEIPPTETDDEELIRVPIVEERVKVINEKVVTGEIVVRKRSK